MWASIWGEEALHAGSVFAALMDGSVHVLRFAVAGVHIRITDSEGDRGG